MHELRDNTCLIFLAFSLYLHRKHWFSVCFLGIFTENISRGHRVAANIDAGVVWINTWLLRDLRIPFGGMKNSGLGREGGFKSLQFFTEPKNVCIKIFSLYKNSHYVLMNMYIFLFNIIPKYFLNLFFWKLFLSMKTNRSFYIKI